jgi:hypothetical protein
MGTIYIVPNGYHIHIWYILGILYIWYILGQMYDARDNMGHNGIYVYGAHICIMCMVHIWYIMGHDDNIYIHIYTYMYT